MFVANCSISIFLGIITYFLLYLNKLQNLNNEVDKSNNNIKCLSSYSLSLKVPLIISLIVWFILNNINNLNDINNTNDLNVISENILNYNCPNNIDLFTDNMSHWL